MFCSTREGFLCGNQQLSGQGSVSQWRKSGQAEAYWQCDSAERGESVVPKAGDDFLN